MIILFLSFVLLAVSCGDSNRQYVRKAVSIMDKQGLFAEDPIAPDIVTETPLEDALGWIANNIIARP